ncbi:MAG TPA: vanadium-dependent haloperoxidase [Chitinophagales bacterium]|nr:vanadium-dependent haloperoxidase [Chitinophagales bacterium]
MFNKGLRVAVFGIAITLASCNNKKPPLPPDEGLVQRLNATLTEAIVHDGFPPPVASRIYAYCHVAGYESVYYTDSSLRSLSGQLNGLSLNEEAPEQLKKLNRDVVLVTAFCNTAVDFVYRDFILEQFRDSMLKVYKPCLEEDVYNNSIKYGQDLAKQIVKWSSKDGYKETRDMPRYRPKETPGTWAPTLPTMGDALEPYWGTLRPFVLDSPGMFKVKDQPLFTTDKNSDYYKDVVNTMTVCSNADKEKARIALFWDCNPQKTIVKGHLMYNIRQLTPGGHWMGITGTACLMKHLSVPRTEEAYALASLGVADGFINTWHEKFRTDRIRPETYVNRYIDKLWRPMLETPLFPEHPSAHSTVSAAAAAVLTDRLGDNFTFIDSTELPFGQGTWEFHSFKEAANQAAISRVYGGIHYSLGCNEGIILGEKIGKLVLERVKTKK